MDLSQYFVTEMFQVFLIFCRVGTCLMMMPGFGDSHVSPRARLILALAFSLIITPTIPNIPTMPQNPMEVLVLVFGEFAIGFMIGSIVKIITSAIHVGGMIIGMQSSLSQSALFDPNQGSQGSVFGSFLDIMALAIMFSLDLHHMLIEGIHQSYSLFAIGGELPLADFASAASQVVSKSFFVGVQMSAPLIIIGILVNLASGILARLMPQFQVFFVIMPVQILVALFVFMMTLSAVMMWYIQYLQSAFENLITP